MNTERAEPPIRVGLISLGCAKNLVDAEIMLGSLLQGGVEIINDAAQADVMIVNTCSFIDAAQEESVDAILESAEVREAKNRGQGLVVAGCLPQRFRDELPKLFPEVDAFMGIDQVTQVTDIVKRALAHRQLRLAQGRPENQRPRAKANLLRGFAELEPARTITPHATPEDIRAADQVGHARTAVTPPPAKPSARRSTPHPPQA